jgi:hypothetical protein
MFKTDADLHETHIFVFLKGSVQSAQNYKFKKQTETGLHYVSFAWDP